MVKCGVLFEVRNEFLNIMQTNFGFKGLKWYKVSVAFQTKSSYKIFK
jgi:hypothetical protein